VELHRLPKALAKLPPQAHRDLVMTDFMEAEIEFMKIERMIDEAIKLYGSLVEGSESELKTQAGGEIAERDLRNLYRRL